MLFTMPAKSIPTGPIAQDGHNEFARNITAKNQDISVDKIAKADIRPMNICREIQPHSALPSRGDLEASRSPQCFMTITAPRYTTTTTPVGYPCMPGLYPGA